MKHFPLGIVKTSPEANRVLKEESLSIEAFLTRHQRGDWGEVNGLQSRTNQENLQIGLMVRSKYPLKEGAVLVIDTAGDRSHTAIWMEYENIFTEVSALEGYARWSESYDIEKNPLIITEEPLVEGILQDIEFSNVLDMGTGTGRWALKLAQRGIQVTAVDQSPEMLAIARARDKEKGLGIEFHQLSLEDEFPFSPGEFDLILSTLMMSHISDLSFAFAKFHHLLAPKGKLLITAFHPDAMSFGWRTTTHRPGVEYGLPNSTNSRSDYIKALVNTGFHVLKFLDIPIHETPPEFTPADFPQPIQFLNVCLIILAEKPE